MHRWAVLVLAAVALPPAGSAQSAAEILQKVSAAYRGTALDIEWVEGYDHHSPALQSATQGPVRMVQSGARTRLEQYGTLYISDGVHNWQYSSAFNEYADAKGAQGNRLNAYLSLARGAQNVRIAGDEPVALQGVPTTCYVIELERVQTLPGGDQRTTRETYWIDKARYLVLKSSSSTLPTAPETPGSATARVIQVTRAATTVADSLFDFKPPAGAVLVDRISATPRSPLFGKPLPAFEWSDLEGNAVSTKGLAGHVAVIRFAPFYSDVDAWFVELLHRALQPKGVVVWDVISGRTEGLRTEAQRLGYTMPLLIGSPDTTASALGFGNGVLNGVLVLDAAGKVVYHSNGTSGTSLQNDVVKALRDAGVW